MKKILQSAVAALAMATCVASWASGFPAKPVKLLVPYAAGGGTDTIARLVVQEMNKGLAQPVVVDNRPGGATMVAAQALLAAPNDGYTAMVAGTDTLASNPNLYKKLPYTWNKDFAFLGFFAKFPFVLVAREGSEVARSGDFLRHIAQNGKKLSFATYGNGTVVHLGMEILAQELKTEMLHVPFNGAAPALQAILSGTADLYFCDIPTAIPLIKNGTVKPLAISTRNRSALLPDVRSLHELGIKDYDISAWVAMMARKDADPAALKHLSRKLSETMDNPEVQKRIQERGVEPMRGGPEEVMAQATKDSAMIRKIVTTRGIALD